MRTKEFTFTKRVKKTETHKGLEVCLTPQEATDLAEVLRRTACSEPSNPGNKFLDDLYFALYCWASDFDRKPRIIRTARISLRPAKPAAVSPDPE